jgi:hypothetical protein
LVAAHGALIGFNNKDEESNMDRTSKIILAFIAGGLWINAAMPLIRPAHSSQVDDIYLPRIAEELATISGEVGMISSEVRKITQALRYR